MPNGSWNPPQVKLKEFKFPWRIAWRNKFKGLKLMEIWANKKQSGLKWVEMAPALEKDLR